MWSKGFHSTLNAYLFLINSSRPHNPLHSLNRELFIANGLSRHFSWSHNIMFVEDLYNSNACCREVVRSESQSEYELNAAMGKQLTAVPVGVAGVSVGVGLRGGEEDKQQQQLPRLKQNRESDYARCALQHHATHKAVEHTVSYCGV